MKISYSKLNLGFTSFIYLYLDKFIAYISLNWDYIAYLVSFF